MNVRPARSRALSVLSDYDLATIFVYNVICYIVSGVVLCTWSIEEPNDCSGRQPRRTA